MLRGRPNNFSRSTSSLRSDSGLACGVGFGSHRAYPSAAGISRHISCNLAQAWWLSSTDMPSGWHTSSPHSLEQGLGISPPDKYCRKQYSKAACEPICGKYAAHSSSKMTLNPLRALALCKVIRSVVKSLASSIAIQCRGQKRPFCRDKMVCQS